MGEDKQTFTDPKTGEEVESTRLARGIVWLVIGVGAGVVSGIFFGMGWEVSPPLKITQ